MTLLLNHSLDQVRKSRNIAQPADRNHGKLRQSNDTWKHDLFENGPEKSSSNPPRLPKTIQDQDNGDDSQADLGRSTSLLITNLHYDVSEAELEALFSQIGKIDRGPFIKFDHSGRATEGLAFVSYANESHAEAAVEAFNGASAKGQPIGVQYEFSIPGWVRSALGFNGRQVAAEGVPPTFGLLGRMQQDRPAGRPHFSPYDRPRGPRASFPPGKPRPASSGRDSRRTTDSFSGGAGGRVPGGRGHRASGRPRWAAEKPSGRAPVKSARELDKELEAFMGSSSSLPVPAVGPVGSDVQMTD
ncbi:hypothetical protein VP01_1005g3 [Puccinia sorghi]|uniref:RRM domain-containing protein n=1 Tax=Puccinia sorghi TaxID=27349 RepID=A0A0L6VWL5_9BASI|nr:hypothetical protein VP01_1005g3 [Puccinia sorghi]